MVVGCFGFMGVVIYFMLEFEFMSYVLMKLEKIFVLRVVFLLDDMVMDKIFFVLRLLNWVLE